MYTYTAVNWWMDETTSIAACQQLCQRLGWPISYADGPADHEWLTDEQLAQLRAVPLEWLDEIDEMELDDD